MISIFQCITDHVERGTGHAACWHAKGDFALPSFPQTVGPKRSEGPVFQIYGVYSSADATGDSSSPRPPTTRTRPSESRATPS